MSSAQKIRSLYFCTPDERVWRRGKSAGILSTLPEYDCTPDVELAVHVMSADEDMTAQS